MLTHRLRYDAVRHIIDLDLTGIVPTPQIIDEVIDGIIATARPLKRKPHLLVNWKGVQLDLPAAKRYGERLEELAPLLTALVRYGVEDTSTRVQIRSEFIKHKVGMRAHFFATREQALAAIANGEV